MNNEIRKMRVNLDCIHSLEISVNENAKTVVTELIIGEEKTFIYAEKFDSPCNYIRTAIKKSIVYLNGDAPEPNRINELKKGKNCICLNTDGYVI